MNGITTMTPNLPVTIAVQQEKAASGKRAGCKTMTEARTATCRCGQLSVSCTGEPVRISACHCYDCQKRSGSVFAAQAFFPADAVTISGEYKIYEHVSDSGGMADFYFCPGCGASLWFQRHLARDRVGIPIGNFSDNDFPAPRFSIYENRKHCWVEIVGEGIEHD